MSKQILLWTFNFEVNAIFAKEALAKLGIESIIKPVNEKQFELFGDAAIKEKASRELDKLNLDETALHKNSEGYLEEVNEWSDHMYNPVYWLEKKKLPHYFTSRPAKRLLGILFLVPGLLLLIVNSQNDFSAFVQSVFVQILSLILGIVLIVQSFRKNKSG